MLSKYFRQIKTEIGIEPEIKQIFKKNLKHEAKGQNIMLFVRRKN